ncbi:MAG: hypothetical protein ACP5KI_02455 [Brevinematia bacterium]
MKYTRFILIRNLPLILLDFILVFFLIYQTSIGNVFLEEVHPSLILIFFVVLVSFYTFYLSTFYVSVDGNKVGIRMGFFYFYFGIDDIVQIKETELKDFSYGVLKDHNIIMFVVDKKPCLEITLKSGEVVIISERRIRKFLELLKGVGYGRKS